MKKSLENDDEAENTIHFVRKEIAQVSKELSEVDDLILDRAVKYVKAINSKKLIYKLPIKPNHNMLEALFGDSSEVEDLETHATANESIITATHRGKMHPGCGVEEHRQSLSPISSPDSYQMGDVRMIGQNLNLRQIPQNSTPRIPQIAPPPPATTAATASTAAAVTTATTATAAATAKTATTTAAIAATETDRTATANATTRFSLDWVEFYEQFKKIVDDTDLEQVFKLANLREKLDDHTKQIIKNYTSNEYPEVLRILEKKFTSPEQIMLYIERHIQTLPRDTQQQSVGDTQKALDRLRSVCSLLDQHKLEKSFELKIFRDFSSKILKSLSDKYVKTLKRKLSFLRDYLLKMEPLVKQKRTEAMYYPEMARTSRVHFDDSRSSNWRNSGNRRLVRAVSAKTTPPPAHTSWTGTKKKPFQQTKRKLLRKTKQFL